MAQGVQLPDGSAVTIRPGETPESAYARAQQMYPESFAAKNPEEGPKSGFMPALKAGFAGLKGDVAALAGRTGIMGLPEAEKYIAEQEAYQKKTFAPTKEGFFEAPLANIKELAGGSIPYMVAPLAAGAALGSAPVAGALGLGAAGATALGLGAAGAASAGQFTASNLVRQMEPVQGGPKTALGETNLINAALAAIPQAALDTVSMKMIPGLGKMFESAGINLTAKAANDLAKEGIKKTAADYLLSTGKTMGIEGLTEAGQQVFERMQAGLSITDPSARAEYFDNFIGGAVLGGILAPAGRYAERGQEQARFDTATRAKQVEERTAASQAAEQAAAAEQAQKQTPEYAQQAQAAYLAAEQRKTELEAQMHRAGKGVKLTEDQKQDNKETQQALKEHADVLKETNANYRASRQFLPAEPAPAPAAIKDTTQLQQSGMFGAPAAPKAPELDMFGQPVERAAPEAAAEPQADPRQQVRMLEQLVKQYAEQAKGASLQEKVALGPKYEQASKALEESRKAVAAMPKSVEDQLAALNKKMGVAEENGDVVLQGKLSQNILNLQQQAVPSAQQGMEMQPFKSTVTGDRQLAVRPRAPNVNLGVEEQEADIAAQQAQAEQAYQALGKDRERQVQLYPEVSALGRMAERNLSGAANINEQLGLFGPSDQPAQQTTPSSAPLGQMKQQLLGEDVTATADEAAPRRPQRGGPAPFNLYPRREGTGAPVTADEIRDRIYALQNRDDLTDEARAFLQRSADRIPPTDKEGVLAMFDEQLGKIERDEEGVTNEGRGKPTEYQGFPVQTPATSTTAPTVAAGKDFEARSTAAAKALAAARRTKYEAGVSAGLSPAEAARRASLVKQEDVTGPFAGRETEAAAPTGEVGVQKRGNAAEASTLRGASTKGKPLSYPDALEQHLRVQEGLKQDTAGQLGLFNEKELESTAITRATPATFQRFLDSKPVQEMREREREAKKQAEQLPEAQKVQASIKELEDTFNKLNNLYEQATTAKSILNKNAAVENAIAQYGRMQYDPMFTSILQLSASSRSEEHAKLVDNIAVFTRAAADLKNQIGITQKALTKPVKAKATVSEGLREKRVKLDILERQQAKLNDTLTKLEALKANADAAQSAKEHIDSMLAVIEAKKVLAALEGTEPSIFDVANARVAITQALDAKRAAEAASKAQDTLRDTRDRSYNTRRKAEEMSAARTRAWNQMASLPSTRYRARTAAEERAFVTAAPGEVSAALKYEQHLAGMAVLPLKMELGRLEQQARVLEKQIQTAKAKSESFLKSADNTAVSLPSPSGPFSPLPNRNLPAATGEKLVMYGPKGSVFTKPAFIGVEGYLKKQADLMVKIDALEKELGVKEASATPIATRKGEVETRAIAPATDEEADLIGMTEEKVAARAAAKERVVELEAALKSSQEEGNKKLVAAFAKDLVQARKELVEAEIAESRRKQLIKRQTSEPSKLMTGSAESKATPGYTKTRMEEQKVEKLPTANAAVEAGNKMATEKLLAAKKLTKKEIAAMSLAQQDALQKAAFDRLMYVREQVSGAQQVVNNLKQVQADYAAGRRSTFNADTLVNANKRLAAFTKELARASQQAGVLEDVGKMSKDELKEAATQAAAETKKGKSAKDVAAQETEAAVQGIAVFRTQTRTGAGMKEQQVARLADRITSTWTTIPEIIVVADEKGLPAHIQEQARLDNMTGKIPGLYDTETKKVYLVAENLHTGEDVALTIAHEVAGHFGLREMLGSAYKPEMNRIYDGSSNVRKDADAKMAANKRLSRETAVEEVLAEMAEKGEPSALRRIYNIIKHKLAQLFGLKRVTDQDVQQVVANARRYVQEGVGGRGGAAAVDGVTYRTADYKSDDALSTLAKRVVATPKTLREKAGSNIALQAEMQVADMRAGVIKALNNAVEDPNTMGSTKLFRQAIFSITAADQHGAITQMALSNGPPKMVKDSKGYYEVQSTMKDDAGAVFDAVQDIPDSYGNTEAKMGVASMYMIAQRAMNKGLRKLDLGAMGVTEQELVDVMSAVDADPKLKAALENARTKYNAYNRGMIEWLASPQVGAITQADAKAYLKDEDYVPYYRVRSDGVAELVFGGEKTITIGDIRHQPYLAELKGGESKIMPLDKSIMRNTLLLVTKGMNNMAMKNVGYAMQAAGQGLGPVDKAGKPTNMMPIHSGKAPADASVIKWTQEPDPSKADDNGDRWLRIQTNDTLFGGIPAELIFKALEGAHLTLPAFLKWGGIAGDLLRAGVTRTPIYLARQLFRDPFAATATSGLDYGPITAIFKANREFLKITSGKSEAGAKMIEKGLMQSGLFEGDPANMSKIALQLASGKSQGVIDKLFAKADKLALQADAATRALIYENAIKNGLSEAEASHAVRESMNFSKRGLSPTVQYASRMIPFFNAQIQGLSVLFKAATGNMPANDVLKIKRKFFNNAMMLTGFGVAYAMAMDDDDYYKNAKPRDRYSNFFMHVPGVDEPVKLPIPYEFGWFFSAGVAAVDAIKGEVDTPQQLRTIKDMFVGAIPGASNLGMPQIVKPIAEVYANKNFYSGNPLESARLQKLDPEARYNAHTTEVAKWMATMVPGLSPIQIEHIVSGYLGQMPLMVLASTNELFRDGKAEPTRKLSDMPLIGSSFQRKYGGEDADVVYKLATDATQAKRTFDNYRNTGKVEDAKDYMREHRAEISVAPIALQYQKLMGSLRTQEELIRGSNASADEKAKRIDALDKQRQLQSERFLKAIRQVEGASDRTTRP